tara:strand:- start:17782 stop:18477 length:696 start_codon:yes stop_codon:yes gene_type:complete
VKAKSRALNPETSPYPKPVVRGRRTKAETIARLEDSAVALFGSSGYEGTSLRSIAAHAGLPLSAIDRHFGSKMALFDAVHRRIWKEIDSERQALLRNPAAVDESGAPSLEAVLYAFIRPIAERATRPDDASASIRLLREMMSTRLHTVSDSRRKPVKALVDHWVEAIMATCPDLSRDRAVWVYSFVVAILYCNQLVDGCLDDLMPANATRSTDEVTGMLVAFCSRGIRGLT